MTKTLDFKHIKGKTKRGLRYLIFKDTNTLYTSVYIIIRAGAMFGKKPGLAHFLEHCFLGLSTKTKTKERRLKETEIKGIYKNASTSYDLITYYLDAPYNQIKYVFETLKEDFTQIKFDYKEVETERSIIKDEISKRNNNIFSILAQYELKDYFKKNTPYVNSILGTKKDLNNINIADLKEHYKLLNNQNMIFGISGNIKEKEVIRLIEDFSENIYLNKGKDYEIKTKFKKYKYAIPKRVVIKPSKLSNNTVFSISKLFKNTHKPKNKEVALKNLTIENVISSIYVTAESSYLWRSLREKSGLVYGYWFDIWKQHYFSIATITLEVPPKNVNNVLNIFKKETEKLLKANISKKTLEYWKNHLKNKVMLSTGEHKKILYSLVRNYYYNKFIITPKDIIKAQEKLNKTQVNKYIEKIRKDIQKDPIVGVFTGNTKNIKSVVIKKYLDIK